MFKQLSLLAALPMAASFLNGCAVNSAEEETIATSEAIVARIPDVAPAQLDPAMDQWNPVFMNPFMGASPERRLPQQSYLDISVSYGRGWQQDATYPGIALPLREGARQVLAQSNGPSIADPSQITYVQTPMRAIFPSPLLDEWRPIAFCDINGDGTKDITWRNQNSGLIYLWPLGKTGELLPTYHAISTIGIEANWELLACGRFEGSGQGIIPGGSVLTGDQTPATASFLWRNRASNQIVTWKFDTNGYIASGRVEFLNFNGNALVVPYGWKVTDVADLDHDGSDDILWMNQNSGQPVVWFMGGNKISGVGLPPGNFPRAEGDDYLSLEMVSGGWNVDSRFGTRSVNPETVRVGSYRRGLSFTGGAEAQRTERASFSLRGRDFVRQ